MKRFRKMFVTLALGCVAAFALTFTTGCDNFEQTTFKTLSSSKAVIDDAQKQYEPSPVGTGTLPHTRVVYDAITLAKAAQAQAVDDLQAYDLVANAKGHTAAQLQNAQTLVQNDISHLLQLVAIVRNLVDGKTSTPAKTSAPLETNSLFDRGPTLYRI